MARDNIYLLLRISKHCAALPDLLDILIQDPILLVNQIYSSRQTPPTPSPEIIYDH